VVGSMVFYADTGYHQLRKVPSTGPARRRTWSPTQGRTSSSHIFNGADAGSVYYSYTNGESGFGPFDRLPR